MVLQVSEETCWRGFHLEYQATFPFIRGHIYNISCLLQRNASLIHHSDRGSQYVSIRYRERLAKAGIERSVGSRGDSYDNALAETINGLYKAELIKRRGPWKTKESVELATLQWVHWFNRIRLIEPIGYIPPAEAEDNYYRQLANSLETIVST